MSFTDGKPFVVDASHLQLPWSGRRDGSFFRCRMCGHRFKVGDIVRFVFTNNLVGPYGGNPLVCQACDGPDVIDRWKKLCDDFHDKRFWWFRERG